MLRLDPYNFLVYTTRARAYIETREYGLAVADCQEALRLNPQEALRLNPNDEYAQKLMGFALKRA